MSSTDAMRARIASELNRALTDSFGNSGETFATVVNREINAAIKHYESTRFRWNEVREADFATTVSGTRTYSLPANFLMMDTLKVKYNGSFIPIYPKSWEDIDRRDTKVTGALGLPRDYVVYGNVLRLYPVPNGAYTLVASYQRRYLPTSATGSYTSVIPVGGSYSYTVTTTASHNNRISGWMSDGEELIRSRAKASIKINYLKNPDAITEMLAIVSRREPYLCAQEAIAFEGLMKETQGALATGYLRAYVI